MLLKNINLKKAIIGATALSILSIAVPEVTQAATFNVSVPHDGGFYKSQFNIRTGTRDSSSNPNLGRYDRGISNYGIYEGNFALPSLVENSSRRFLDLTISKYGNIATIPDNLAQSFVKNSFTNLTGATIYEYSFTVPNFQNIPLAPIVPSPFGTDGTVKWYVPSKFTYTNTKSGNSFSIDLGDGKNQLLNSLKNFDIIFNTARNLGLSQISFPTNSTTSLLSRQAIEANNISPAAIPESNTSAGLMVLGLIGSYLIIKRKSTVELKRLD